jgi:hypothetical protein
VSDYLCSQCDERLSKHADGKCLFEPTDFAVAYCVCNGIMEFFENDFLASCRSCSGREQREEIEREMILGFHEN